MKKALLLLAVAGLMVNTSGCGCCRKKPQAVATPVYSQCAPTCQPACDPCNNGMVTYGTAPVTTFQAPSL